MTVLISQPYQLLPLHTHTRQPTLCLGWLAQCLVLAGLGGMHLQVFSQAVVLPTPGSVQDSVPERRVAPLSTPAEVVFPRDAPPPVPRAEGRRFLVSGFTFTGNSVVPEAMLRRLVERYLDLELTLAELDRVADTITAFYRAQGFTVARAFLPVQRVEDGLVTIQVIEGRIELVTFKGVNPQQQAYLTPYLSPFTSREQDVLVTDAALERQLLLLNDLPGIKARATLSPGSKFGTTDIEVAIEEKPVAVALGWSNFGRSEIGRNRVELGLQWNSPLRRGDQLGIRAIRSTDGLFRYALVQYSLPLGARGLRLAISANRTEYDLAGAFTALGISGKVRSADATLSYPLLRSRSKNAIASLQVRQTSSEQSALGAVLSKNKLPLAVASLYSNWIADDSSATALNLALASNFRKNKQNQTSDPERVGIKMDGELTYLTGATRNWDLYLRGRAVLSTQALPDTEKLSIGGVDSVRAYPSAHFRGDKGYLATLELRRQLTNLGVPGYATVFVDTAGVRSRGFLGTDRLSGIGVGISHYLGRVGQIKAEYAYPLETSGNRGGDRGRTWVTVNLAF